MFWYIILNHVMLYYIVLYSLCDIIDIIFFICIRMIMRTYPTLILLFMLYYVIFNIYYWYYLTLFLFGHVARSHTFQHSSAFCQVSRPSSRPWHIRWPRWLTAGPVLWLIIWLMIWLLYLIVFFVSPHFLEGPTFLSDV